MFLNFSLFLPSHRYPRCSTAAELFELPIMKPLLYNVNADRLLYNVNAEFVMHLAPLSPWAALWSSGHMRALNKSKSKSKSCLSVVEEKAGDLGFGLQEKACYG